MAYFLYMFLIIFYTANGYFVNRSPTSCDFSRIGYPSLYI